MNNHSLIANYLLSGGSLQDLEDQYHLRIKPHNRYPNLLHFEYNQRDSPMHEPLVQEARGLILDSADNWKVINKTLTKFFNYGESNAAPVDWSSAQVEEKVDGSLINLWHYRGQWHISTTGSADANGSLYNIGFIDGWEIETSEGVRVLSVPNSFAEYFWQVVEHKSFKLKEFINLNLIPHELCLAFELTGPLNPVVVKHPQPNITLLMSRNRETDQQFYASYINESIFHSNLNVVKSYPLTSIQEILQTFEIISPFDQEGYVVIDKFFRRIKVKNPKYVALHHCITNMNIKDFLLVIKNGDAEEVSAYSQLHAKIIEKIKEKLNILIKIIDVDFKEIQHIELQKEFAFAALKKSFPDALFQLKAKKYKSGKDYVDNLKVEKIMDFFKKIKYLRC